MERFLDEPSDGQLGNVCKANDISCKRGEIGRLAVHPDGLLKLPIPLFGQWVGLTLGQAAMVGTGKHKTGWLS